MVVSEIRVVWWGGGRRRTRPDHSLTTHDEDDLHRPKLLHTQTPPRPDGEPQLGAEDDGRDADADDQCDVGGRGECTDGVELRSRTRLQAYDTPSDIQHHQRKSQTADHESADAVGDVDRNPLERRQITADDADLHCQ